MSPNKFRILIHSFILSALASWLVACGESSDDVGVGGLPTECSNQPGNTVDVNGYCVSESETVIAGETLTLTLDNAQLSVPADALDTGTTVTLAEVFDGGLVSLPNGSDETLITPVYALAFSAAQLATGSRLTFTFDIPTSVTTGFYARIKIEGGLGTDGQSDTDWLIVIGEYDAQQSQLTIELGATATRLLVAGISTNEVVTPTASVGLITDSKDPESMVSRSLAATAITPLPFSVPDWTSHGWVVFCDPNAFSKLDLTTCNPLSPDFHPMMNNIATKLYASDKQLTSLGFLGGDMRIINHVGIERTKLPYVIYDPDNRSASTSSTDGVGTSYFIAALTPDTNDKLLGLYDPSVRQIFVDQFESDGTIIHELMHAVQRVQIEDAWDQIWIIEGIAAAIEDLAPSSSPSGGAFRYEGGDWRDWDFPLSNEDDLNEYQVLEYWLSLDVSLSLFPSFYDNLRAYGTLTDGNIYSRVDAALTDTGLPSLRESYANLIAARNNDAGYQYCDPVFLACVSGESCEQPVNIPPISADCIDIIVEPEVLPECPDTPPDIKVTLVTDENPNIGLMVDGVMHEANKPVPFSGEGRIWAINTDVFASTSPVAALKFTNKASCYLEIVKQNLFAMSIAEINEITVNTLTTPAGVSQQIMYQSFEDLSFESKIITVNQFDMGAGQPSVSERNDEIVEPLGLETWTGNTVANATHQCSIPTAPELCPLRTADAEASVTSFTEDGGNSLITRGVHSAFATVELEKSGTRSSGVANSIYTYKNNVSAELNLTWDCTMSIVKVTDKDQQGLSRVRLEEKSVLSTSWDDKCGSMQTLAVAPMHQVEIQLITKYESYLGVSTSGKNEDVGGFYEIELKAIVPAGSPI